MKKIDNVTSLFLLTLLFSLIGIGYFVQSIFVINQPIKTPKVEQEASVEINLPVLDWNNYLNLSKGKMCDSILKK